MKEFYTIAELSELLSIPRPTLYAMTTRGDVPAFKIGKALRFKIVDIENWLAGKKIINGSEDKKARDVVKSMKKTGDVNLDKLIANARKEIL